MTSAAFDQPIPRIIRQRSSRRSYQDRLIAAGTVDQLRARIATIVSGPLGSALRIVLRQNLRTDLRALRSYGTYGFIKGAQEFLIGAVTRGPFDHEDFGYGFETAILHATDLGLGTCWLGGSLDRSLFGEIIGVGDQELVPAVSPVGYATEKRALRDRVIRLGAQSHRRHAWERLFFDGAFDRPLSPAAAGGYADCLEMVRLGPSASNQQPWRLVRASDRPAFHFYRQRSRYYASKITKRMAVDLQRVDLGIAMSHFAHTAASHGLAGEWEYRAPSIGRLPERTEYVVSWIDQS